MAKYRYLAVDPLTMAIREEIPFDGVKYSFTRNAPGTFQATLPARHSKCTRAILEPCRTAIFIERDGQIVWGGLLWTAQAQSGTERNTVTFGGSDYLSGFANILDSGRFIRETLTYTNYDIIRIARELIDYAQNESKHGYNADLGVVTGVALTTDTGDQRLHTRTYYWYDWKGIYEAIRDLANLKNSFNFRIICQYSGGNIEKRLSSTYPSLQSPTGVVFELERNVNSVTDYTDGGPFASRVIALGSGDAEGTIYSERSDPASPYILRESTRSHRDVTEQATLDDYSSSYLQRLKKPRWVPTFVVNFKTEPNPLALRMGDVVTLRGDDGYVDYNDVPYIMVDTEVRVGEEGQEEATVRFNELETLEETPEA